ncbi:MAG: hypothetical protein QOG13_2633 [Sphingomonadales bacterium]|jgi:mono/diheme cytochrome c family protein|nr:hypothetical protein [Sphingomonadales bacterium]
MRTSLGRHSGKLALGTALGLSIAGVSLAQPGPVYVDQGSAWTQAARTDFYSRDQGSRIIPLAWLRALKTASGQPFLHDGLARYGYLPNPNGSFNLPVGFMAVGAAGRQDAAMNCSACHTRQIAVGGTEYRIDGGPALTDFQAFLTDLDAAVGRVLADNAAFAAFAAAVPGGGPDLRQEVAAWYRREHALISGALPPGDKQWGLGRLDAVSMIYNRLTAMDLGPPPSYMIDGNIRLANAPVRYPFLWNAPTQDRTQWPGFAENGSDVLALARNLGQVYGVFGVYRPRRQGDRVDFLTGNSTDWRGLERLESLVMRIGPPQWPWPVTTEQQQRAERGRAIFERPDWRAGGCVGCHGIRPGVFRPNLNPPRLNATWATPLCDIGTDTAQYGILDRRAHTGVLEGARLPFGPPLGEDARAFDLLKASVIGSIVQRYFVVSPYHYANWTIPLSRRARGVLDAYAPPSDNLCSDQPGPLRYESRVLQGIWATAPYLHNGSVPTLADLLTRPQNRPASFRLGRNYDTALVGLARDQGASTAVRTTTGCDRPDSGNSRCGHDFGTNLSATEKAELLEYLKTLGTR